MIKAFSSYTLITGSHGKAGSIWRGPDHLLIVEGRGFLLPTSEQYRRIDYQNIQALTTVRTSHYVWYAILLGALAVVFGLAFLATLEEARGLQVATGAPCGLFVILLLIHLMRGSTCRCALQTAVLTLRLRPISRWRKGRAVLAEIERLCREHQGEFPEGALAASSVPPLKSNAHAGTKPQWPGSPWLLAAGLSIMAWGAMVAGDLFVPDLWYSVGDLAVGVIAFLLLLIAIVRAYRYQTPGGLRAVLWTTMILQPLFAIGSYAGAVIVRIGRSVQDRVRPNNPDFEPQALFRFLAGLSFDDMGNAGWLVVGFGAILLLLGGAMILFSLRPKALRIPPMDASPPPPPPSPAS